MTLEKVKLYLRVDGNEEDDLLESFLNAAESYLSNAITNYADYYETNEKFQAQADLLKLVIVSEQFNNRDGRNDPRNNFAFVIRSMVNQLQYFVAEDTSS